MTAFTKIAVLREAEITWVYNTYMLNDFPDDERKPLAMLLKACADGNYTILGFYSEERLLAYACISIPADRPNGAVLLDYLAVIPEERGHNWGSAVLHALRDRFPGGILVECEALCGADEAQLCERERRIRFYRNNGATVQPFEVTLFHVRYAILYIGESTEIDTQNELDALYVQMLGQERKKQFTEFHKL